MDKVNVKGVSFWDGTTFQTVQEDFYVPLEKLQELMDCSKNVLDHALKSVASIQNAMGGVKE
jgi:uncharacterized protein YukE